MSQNTIIFRVYTCPVTRTLKTSESGDENEFVDALQPYAGEPLADQEWIEAYQKEREDEERNVRVLQDRLRSKLIVGKC